MNAVLTSKTYDKVISTLLHIYTDDFFITANIISAQADGDYKYIMNLMKDTIQNITKDYLELVKEEYGN